MRPYRSPSAPRPQHRGREPGESPTAMRSSVVCDESNAPRSTAVRRWRPRGSGWRLAATRIRVASTRSRTRWSPRGRHGLTSRPEPRSVSSAPDPPPPEPLAHPHASARAGRIVRNRGEPRGPVREMVRWLRPTPAARQTERGNAACRPGSRGVHDRRDSRATSSKGEDPSGPAAKARRIAGTIRIIGSRVPSSRDADGTVGTAELSLTRLWTCLQGVRLALARDDGPAQPWTTSAAAGEELDPELVRGAARSGKTSGRPSCATRSAARRASSSISSGCRTRVVQAAVDFAEANK